LSKKGLNLTEKGIRHRNDGVVHHALAFNTLLNSQETDAYSPELREALFVSVFRCVFILSAIRFTVKFGASGIPTPPRLRGNSPTILRHLTDVKAAVQRHHADAQ
ncbi:hypothetical protein AB0H64_35055, partial [Nonomuraea sp. NPDC050733]|uniref:hypothetical protein n=1 Tax=Nonomuraea sp. NPDC050733 TaxID=3154633 RepID=UPI0033EA6243